MGALIAILLFPVFDVFRYDIDDQTLYLFGHPWGLGIREAVISASGSVDAGFVTIQVLTRAMFPWLLALSFFPLMGFLFGRFFCGWFCPEGLLFEYADWLCLKIIGRRSIYGKKSSDPPVEINNRALYGTLAVLSLLVIAPVTGVFLSGYLISPRRIWHELVSLEPSGGLLTGIVGVTIYMYTTSIFVRHEFCRYVCAAGLMQMLFGWISPFSLRIRFDRERFFQCTDCRKCEKTCFMDVKPRLPKRDINCVNCGKCIVACERELGAKKGLFGYRSGKN
ncbi:4Fe-4S binding protein [Candidatus Magnetobacterium casense]|uniref:4Fe-4S binding protein n=1 Tax=Candidatus Magnetobacterium casense TaxID=1455061 RepID=A0ABS6RVX2_9BACT|nr:4Fe-4S binding protein [Candidatus Magnetobacterium casensis]MBV6340418.1 4Fe-4S binding protein [Candidatus Magnetobacterium casensis]